MKQLIYMLLFCVLVSSCEQKTVFRVLQFNIWQEGTQVDGGYNAIVQQIIDSKADLIAFSEVRNYHDTRFCDRMVESLRERGETFYSFYSYDSGILSRYPITDSLTVFPENGDHGSIYKAIINVSGQEIGFYTAHLDYLNCTYYDIKGYSGTTWEKRPPMTDLDSIMANNMASMRDDAIRNFITEAKKDLEKGRIVMIGGDFNEPSHLDWTEATKDLYNRQGLLVPWTVSILLEQQGYKDAYRVQYPNPLKHPGITYPADCSGAPVEKLTWAPESDERERIDFIYYFPDKHLQLQDAVVWGPSGSISRNQRVQENERTEVGSGIWPSDHKAVLVTMMLKNKI